MSKQRMAVLIASALGMIATFLPWATVFGVSVSGDSGDGWITFFIFVVPLIVSLMGTKTEPLGKGKLACIIAGAINIIIGIAKIMDFNSATSGAFSSMVSIGFGLYLVIIAGIGVCVASYLKLD